MRRTLIITCNIKTAFPLESSLNLIHLFILNKIVGQGRLVYNVEKSYVDKLDALNLATFAFLIPRMSF